MSGDLWQNNNYMIIINSNFHLAVEKYRALPFAWGSNDCALFVANIYDEAFDIDLAEGIRGTYYDEYHGMRKIVELGGWDKLLTDHGFVKRDNINFVQRGDIVIFENSLGIWLGTWPCLRGQFAHWNNLKQPINMEGQSNGSCHYIYC